MNQTLWKSVVALVRRTVSNSNPRHTYSDRDIVLHFFWAVLNDRPISWACRRENWPIWAHARPMPWPSTMTRRLRTKAVRDAITACEIAIRNQLGKDDVIFAIDGKPLTIGGSSGDPDAGYGRATGGMAKGYKLHAIIGESGAIWGWVVLPMNVDERPVARWLIGRTVIHDVLLGDRNYDANYLFEAAGMKGIQLLTNKRYRHSQNIGHHWNSPYRLRCIEAVESEPATKELLARRPFIERVFGNLVSVAHGLGDLPAWARRLRRVRRWVQAKLIIFMVGRLAKQVA